MALLSALWFAAAGAVQHGVTHAAAKAAPADHWLPVVKVLRPILTSRIWWIGLSLNALGFLFHATALNLTALGVVQAVLSLQLMFAIPFASVRTRTLPLARDWIGTALVCLGIVTLMAVRGTGPNQLTRPAWVPVVMAVAALTLICLVALAKVARTSRTALVGIAAGVGYSITATLVTIATGQFVQSGWSAVLSHWHVYALVLSGLVATLVTQDAFASGSFPAALTAMTITDPVASSLWGALLFDRVPPATPMTIGSLTLCAALICTGVALLAYSPTLAPASSRT